MTNPAPSPFVERSRYYLATEYPKKIRLAVSGLSREDVWKRSNEESNSIGNLIVHLAGNIRQWIVSGIGGAPDDRNRPAEFAMREGPASEDLLQLLEAAVRDADAVLAGLGEDDLARARTIQGRDTTVLAAVYHVVEHFSMHAGQIIMMAKVHAPGTVRFYDDADGQAVPLWGGEEGMQR